MEFRNRKRNWFDKWYQSCNFFYESPKKYSFQLLDARSVRNKVDLITQLIIDYNYSISAITDTWLTTNDSALSSQLTPYGFKVLLANKYTQRSSEGLYSIFGIHHIVAGA